MNLAIIHLFGNMIEMSLIVMFFNIVLGERKKSSLFPLAFVCLLSAYTLINALTKPPYPFLAIYILVVFSLSFFYPKNLKNKLAFGFLYILSNIALDYLFMLIINALNINELSAIYPVLIINIFRFLILVFISNSIKKSFKLTDDKLLVQIFAFSLVSVIFIIIANDLSQKNYKANIVQIFTVAFLVIAVIILLHLLKLRSEKESLIIELNSIKRENDAKRDYFDKIAEYERTISTLRHDYINRITAIMISNEVSMKTELEKLVELTNREEHGIYTDNILINYLLTEKLKQIEILKENLKISIGAISGLKIAPGDVGVVLGNALDNSIEALSHLCLDDRLLEIDIALERGTFIINIINSFDKNYKRLDNKNRGYGLKSIEQIVSDYAGYLVTEKKDSFIFRAVMLNTQGIR